VKYVFRFLWAVVFLFFAGIGISLLAHAPDELAGYVVLAACIYLGLGFHQLISVHYRANPYDNNGKAFWLGWVLMLFPVIALWHSYQIFVTHAYEHQMTRRRWMLNALNNWLGDTFGYGAPVAMYVLLGVLSLMLCVKLMRDR
jgi:hypothetical protein